MWVPAVLSLVWAFGSYSGVITVGKWHLRRTVGGTRGRRASTVGRAGFPGPSTPALSPPFFCVTEKSVHDRATGKEWSQCGQESVEVQSGTQVRRWIG